MPFTPDQIEYVDIYPPINIARVGDSKEHFIGSEVPGVEPIPEGGFKDNDHKIKKQAARFRVYAFDKDSKPLGEIGSDDYSMHWTVHVANKKGAWVHFSSKYKKDDELELRNGGGQKPGDKWPYNSTNDRTEFIIDSGEVTIEGKNIRDVPLKGEFGKGGKSPISVQLGEIRTDEQGRLLVLASNGESSAVNGDEELKDGFNNDGWVDKMCDGTVRVTVKCKSQPDLKIPVKNKRATIITAPPRFASGTHCPTTLYELIEDIYEKPKRVEGYSPDVEYYRHIYSLFKRIYLVSWTNKSANEENTKGHGPAHITFFENPDLSDPDAGNKARRSVMKWIRAPVIPGNKENEDQRNRQASGKYMPRLSGDAGDAQDGERDTWVSLTQLQYDRLKKWSEGTFTKGTPEVPYKSFDVIPLDEQPDCLTRAALEWSIGAPLYPGIEVYWSSQFPEMYNPEEKFRHADTVAPGDLTKGLCLPWQSDFNMCQLNWWPSVRPDDVVTEAYFLELQQITPSNQLADKLENRWRWDEGIQGETDNASNTDMVRKWNKLGFVARREYEAEPENREILIESQRNLPRA